MPPESPLQAGDPAPDFDAAVVGGAWPPGSRVQLNRLRGRTVVLYFYPKDDTPGCTKQACALRDGWSRIADRAEVFGVSVDTPASHEKFIRKHALPFALISDSDHRIVESYGVWVEKSLYGRKYMGTERTTFIIGPEGRIQAVLPKVKPDEHLERVLALL